MGLMDTTDKVCPAAPLGIDRPTMTDEQRDALLDELKSAVIDMGIVVMSMAGDVPAGLRNYVKGLEMSLQVLTEEM